MLRFEKCRFGGAYCKASKVAHDHFSFQYIQAEEDCSVAGCGRYTYTPSQFHLLNKLLSSRAFRMGVVSEVQAGR